MCSIQHGYKVVISLVVTHEYQQYHEEYMRVHPNQMVRNTWYHFQATEFCNKSFQFVNQICYPVCFYAVQKISIDIICDRVLRRCIHCAHVRALFTNL